MPPAASPKMPSGIARSVHIIGVGGAGMAALAEILLSLGHKVSGSDLKESPRTTRIQELGANVSIGHYAENVAGAELVVHSTAISPSNVEITEAEAKGIPVWARHRLLEALSSLRSVLAVAGSHGKTTATSMLALILAKAGLDPSFLIGGDVNEIGSGAYWSEGEWLLVEADESDGSFLSFSPKTAIVISMEPDHHTRYDTYRKLCEGFCEFLETVEGDKVLHHSVPQKLKAELGEEAEQALQGAITFGEEEDADFSVKWIGETSSCQVLHEGKVFAEVELPVPGRHNTLNAVSALIAAHLLGVSASESADALAQFAGVSRRFEFKGTVGGVTFVDDYAHHPTEVMAAIATARELNPERVVCVYQPHRFSRTQNLWQEFGPSFADVDTLMVTSIYSAGEMPIPGVTGDLIANAASDANPELPVMWLPQLSDVVSALEDELRSGDLCLVLGAGDVDLVIDEITERLAEKTANSDSLAKPEASHRVGRLPEPRSEAAGPEDLAQDLLELLPDADVTEFWDLGKHTTYRVGGEARVAIVLHSLSDLSILSNYLSETELDVLVLGKGANMLVSDSGFEGLVIRLAGDFNRFEVSSAGIICGAACSMPAAARRSVAVGLEGFEWAVGVPGSIGGGVKMNAGGHGSDISSNITSATLLDITSAQMRTLTKEELNLGYRTSDVKTHEVICEANFELGSGDPTILRQEIADILRWRRDNQPGGQNCGSVFKNPSEAPAALLIDEANLKGHRVGTARVSEKHANFFIADRGGKADDVCRLMGEVAEKVERATGILLAPETVLVGFNTTNK